MKTCNICKELKPLSEFYNFYNGKQFRCKKCDNDFSYMTNAILKLEFIIAYGGKCSCCGETEVELLTIEHIKNKGHKLLRANSSKQMLRKLKALGWPDGYTVLCYNCNCSTKMGRPCIHSKEYAVYEQEFATVLNNNSSVYKKQYTALKYKLQIMNGMIKKIA